MAVRTRGLGMYRISINAGQTEKLSDVWDLVYM